MPHSTCLVQTGRRETASHGIDAAVFRGDAADYGGDAANYALRGGELLQHELLPELTACIRANLQSKSQLAHRRILRKGATVDN
eukprot:1743820-Rhodomonas_salina.1